MKVIIENIIFWFAAILTVSAIIDFVYNNFISPKGGKIPRKRLIIYLLSLTVIIIAGFITNDIKSSKIYAGEKYEDKYISLLVKNKVRGPFYNCERYDFSLDITNNQGVMLMIPKMDFFFFNPNVRKLIGMPPLINGSYYQLVFDNPGGGFLKPNENKTINVTGPEFIPEKVQISVTHSGSELGSTTEFILSNEDDVQYWISPKHVKFLKNDFGIDGMHGYRQASRIAKELLRESFLAFCLAMEHTMTKQNNGLNIYKVTAWSFLFVTPDSRKGAWIPIDDSIPKGGAVFTKESIKDSRPTDVWLMSRSSGKPILIGSTEAIMIVDELGLIYGNACRGLWLEPDGLVNGEKRPIWGLPYAGKDYMDLYVDAYTGDILALDLAYQQTGKGPPWKFNVKSKMSK